MTATGHIFRPVTLAAAGVVAAGLSVSAVFAVPVLAGVADRGQPARGTSVEKTTDYEPGQQPPAGTSVEKTTDYQPSRQP